MTKLFGLCRNNCPGKANGGDAVRALPEDASAKRPEKGIHPGRVRRSRLDGHQLRRLARHGLLRAKQEFLTARAQVATEHTESTENSACKKRRGRNLSILLVSVLSVLLGGNPTDSVLDK